MGLLSIIPMGYRLIALALLVVAIFGYGWFRGNEHGTQKLIDYQAEQAKEAVRIVTARGAVTEKIVTKYIEVVGKTKTVTQTVEKETVRYETLKLDRNILSVAAVSLHDSAADNAVPSAAKSIDGTPSGVETAALVSTCTANYAIYHTVADRLRGLQGWVMEQQKVR
jgi:hypothetical protein